MSRNNGKCIHENYALKLEQENQALRELLKESDQWTMHSEDCDAEMMEHRPCMCGLHKWEDKAKEIVK